MEATLDKASLGKLAGQVRKTVPETAAELPAIAERISNTRRHSAPAGGERETRQVGPPTLPDAKQVG